MATGNLTEDRIVAEIAKWPESQVLLRRFAYRDDMLGQIAAHMSRAAPVSDRYLPGRFAHFAPRQDMSSAEALLLSRFERVADRTLGGVDGPGEGIRLDRPQSQRALSPRSIVARPPGSAQEIGACLVAASRVMESKTLLLEALDVAMALSCTQTPVGGWEKFSPLPDRCDSRFFDSDEDRDETLDDGTVPSIVYFAYDLSDLLRERMLGSQPWLDRMISRALSFAVRLQLPNGSWPQSTESTIYHPLSTLNDDVTTGMIRLLVAAYERSDDGAYLNAAIRGGEFLLLAQGDGDQPAFAQQYTTALEPASARAFEPAAYSSLETGYAINALLDLYLATADERFRSAAVRAAGWLADSGIGGQWTRFYEIGTNRPIYATRAGSLVYDIAGLPESERTTYRWIGGRETFPEIGLAMDRLQILKQGVDALRSHDAEVSGQSLLAATPTARLPLDPEMISAGFPDSSSARVFAKHCAGLVAREAGMQVRYR